MSKELKQIEERRRSAESELKELEQFIYNLETNYLRDSSVEGNIVKGWEVLLSIKPSKSITSPASKKQYSRAVPAKDRVFTLSSTTLMMKLSESENFDTLIPNKRNPSNQGKTPKKGKKKNSETDEYSEDIA